MAPLRQAPWADLAMVAPVAFPWPAPVAKVIAAIAVLAEASHRRPMAVGASHSRSAAGGSPRVLEPGARVQVETATAAAGIMAAAMAMAGRGATGRASAAVLTAAKALDATVTTVQALAATVMAAKAAEAV
ncbi:hypothetical protein Vretifemale_14631, partial [Volvox reticuliferus]